MKKKIGRPSRGLEAVLFIRVDQPLLDRLDALLEMRRVQNASRTYSRSDVVRELLQAALDKDELQARALQIATAREFFR